MTLFYFEADLTFSRSEWNETKKGIVMDRLMENREFFKPVKPEQETRDE